MEIKTIADCFKFRLLRRIKPDIDKTNKSFEISKARLNDAKNLLKIDKMFLYQHAIVDSYTAMFHAARALLYKDGIQEKSHFVVYIYLKENYNKKIPLNIINLLNIYRVERHEALYGLDYKPAKEDAQQAIKDAELFIKETEKAIKENI